MGCQSCRTEITHEEITIIKKIMDCIERDDISSLEYLIEMLSFKEKIPASVLVNKRTITLKNIIMNFLAYAVWLGRARSYAYLVNDLNASVEVMEEIFLKENMSAIYIICERGYIDLLKQYLPHYLKAYSYSKNDHDKNSTLSFTTHSILADMSSSYSPIQIASKLGYVSIVHYLHEYFTDKFPPIQLDIHYIDETTGENCALISAKIGNFIMIKMLNEIACADFKVKNKNNEGVIQIMAAASRSRHALQYLECIKYLVEVVKVDIAYMHEEVLFLLEHKIIIKYIEEKLKEVGINASKNGIEETSRMRSIKPSSENSLVACKGRNRISDADNESSVLKS